ncbi:hypothetical protein DDE83_004177 [Stemphylium lycopersici]|uniref:DUF6536 domain-containing protein n=1 Tax=Stemphylium lycopersici TaxID=183478 RepID=A0A364N5W7_STELY|nr:hypothetical protein DDE83_004177 [Stemphylium lycopersici]
MFSKKPDASSSRLSIGWRRTGIINLVSIWLLSIVILTLLSVSASNFRKHDTEGDVPAPGLSVIYRGSCSHSSNVDISVHILINAIGTLIIASSNFFMQILTAPTRKDIDRAHQRQKSLEIGVQSLHNLAQETASCTKGFFWMLLCLSSIPFHLFFNASVYTVNVSTESMLLLTTEQFLHGADFQIPGIGAQEYDWESPGWPFPYDGRVERATAFVGSMAADATSWKNMSVDACMDIYNDPMRPLRAHRNVVMVVRDPADPAKDGWRTSEVRKDLNATLQSDLVNSLFFMDDLWRNDYYIQWSASDVDFGSGLRSLAETLHMNLETKMIKPEYTAEPAELEAMYCMVEPYEEACEVRVVNTILLVCWIFSIVKALVCLRAFFLLRRKNLLVTLGDAIDSFISTPDSFTGRMCCAGAPTEERFRREKQVQWSREPSPWNGVSKRLGIAVSRGRWIASYLIFIIFIGIGIGLLGAGSFRQPVTKSSFGRTPQTLGHNINPGGAIRSDDMGDMHRALYANLPHLALATCYFLYNNILTRLLSEREISQYGVSFQPLRVSLARGAQKPTHRLQLPYAWSIPLISISGFLHWMLSNCIFPKVNVGYEFYPPYKPGTWTGRGLGYSTLALLITLVACVAAVLLPVGLGCTKLRSDMLVVRNDSAVLAAACHAVVPEASADVGVQGDEVMEALMSRGEVVDMGCGERGKEGGEVEIREDSALRGLAAGKLRWGVVVRGLDGRVGHLAFGNEEQYCGPPEDGHWYAGS